MKEHEIVTESQRIIYDQVNEIWSRIRSVLMELGYKGDKIAYRKDKMLESNNLDVGLAWLKIFEREQVTEYVKAKTLVPATVWEMYKATNTTGTYEQKRLAAAKRNLIEVWRTRPSILRRDNVKDARTKNPASGKGFTGITVPTHKKSGRLR